MNYRRFCYRSSLNGGQTWGQFYHYLTNSIILFYEYVFPSCASFSDDYIYMTYLFDNDPGILLEGSSGPWAENFIQFEKSQKMKLWV